MTRKLSRRTRQHPIYQHYSQQECLDTPGEKDYTQALLKKLLLHPETMLKFTKGHTFHLPNPYRPNIKIRKGTIAVVKMVLGEDTNPILYLLFKTKPENGLWVRDIPFHKIEILEGKGLDI